MSSLSRKELIKALVKGLKLDDNIFNYQAVAEETELIQNKDFMDFYKAVMAENTYGNGLQAIIKVAERFKPQIQDDSLEVKAKELIDLVKGMNNQVYKDSERMGATFDELLKVVKFPSVSDEDKAILNAVKPFCELKTLVAGINTYATSLECLNAFKRAVQRPSVAQLENPVEKLQIKSK